jgi:hypothetical protein
MLAITIEDALNRLRIRRMAGKGGENEGCQHG